MKCATHPEIETNLTCNKCGRPICPKCMVQTPVGARCPECAQLTRLPTFSISKRDYLKALGMGLGTAIVGSVTWWVVRHYLPFPYLNVILLTAIGYAVGELVSLSVNRKRHVSLAVLGGMLVVLSYPLSFLLPGRSMLMSFNYLDLLGIVLGILVAANRLR